jgi:hypothetical protein
MVIRMKRSRISTSFAALAIVFGATVAASSLARANDCTLSFGGRAASQSAATHFSDDAEESGSARVSAITLASSFAHHEGHSGLGANIAWRQTAGVVDMREHEGDSTWSHHDDDGDDDGHKTSVPEPSTALLVFSGISALAGWRVRRRKQEITPRNLA